MDTVFRVHVAESDTGLTVVVAGVATFIPAGEFATFKLAAGQTVGIERAPPAPPQKDPTPAPIVEPVP